MFGPARQRPCPMCTSLMGSFESKIPDLRQRVGARLRRPLADRAPRRSEARPRLDPAPGLLRPQRRLHPRLRQRRGRRRPRLHRLHPPRRHHPPLLERRDRRRHGRPRPGPSRPAGDGPALAPPRHDARGPRHRLVPEARLPARRPDAGPGAAGTTVAEGRPQLATETVPLVTRKRLAFMREPDRAQPERAPLAPRGPSPYIRPGGSGSGHGRRAIPRLARHDHRRGAQGRQGGGRRRRPGQPRPDRDQGHRPQGPPPHPRRPARSSAASPAPPPTPSPCSSGWRRSSRPPPASCSAPRSSSPRTGAPTSTCATSRRC